MHVVNSDLSKQPVTLIPPNTWDYVLVLAEIDPDAVTTTPAVARDVSAAADTPALSATRQKFYDELATVRGDVASLGEVRAVTVFDAILFAPGSLDRFAARGGGTHRARFDTILLVETQNTGDGTAVRDSAAFTELLGVVQKHSTYVSVFTAGNVKKTAAVDRDRPGVFLLNFFFADDTDRLVAIWDRTAGWWQNEGKMANSELLLPDETSDTEYAVINNARWDDATAPIAAFENPHYWEFVLANIDGVGATAMPSLYRVIG